MSRQSLKDEQHSEKIKELVRQIRCVKGVLQSHQHDHTPPSFQKNTILQATEPRALHQVNQARRNSGSIKTEIPGCSNSNLSLPLGYPETALVASQRLGVRFGSGPSQMVIPSKIPQAITTNIQLVDVLKRFLFTWH